MLAKFFVWGGSVWSSHNQQNYSYLSFFIFEISKFATIVYLKEKARKLNFSGTEALLVSDWKNQLGSSWSAASF